jgi:hypothetical protein
MILVIIPVLTLLLAACAIGPATYRGPAETDENAAVVYVGQVSESYSVSYNSSWIQIIAVDGQSTGPARWVRVSPGEHSFRIRHHDPYALFYGNIARETVTFRAEPGGRYRIDGSYCCGFILGQFAVFVTDEATGQQIAELAAAE